jgi:hypothetical protein
MAGTGIPFNFSRLLLLMRSRLQPHSDEFINKKMRQRAGEERATVCSRKSHLMIPEGK